ncbi:MULTISPECIES: potassium-transporting ATPase subunit KdpC [unclassified Lysobacter]|uniref:potassium-transporting ATPase subunit KdpC n=1 Tax=unclassified Lysobacter TaxID=2635362 RepID=UPI001BEB39CE|nr:MULTISPECIES: potassium-transporting ATPase subunit KdpC [unclassified Lysobacter]MBT2749492.1 potassium-transporting ATPase subunit KdpC [Lysobacter sp. ISL-42]MBT2754302.1 potassium-transporting ATPase subunit KdpC [Lysobacter sp. ISL-50]MBT2779624.1 potassium-transporting ATPase subunit KdpC [Lysobacter sp. ISL-54]MBT2784736.1 potassium-transporting ATPase subunit KdpC [Lysobacter sp. ISL-52]
MNTSTTQAASIDDRIALRTPLLFAAVALLGFGLLYSLAGTALGRVAFPWQATGSIIEHDGHAVGSALIAQPFLDAKYFQARPSAAKYDPTAASGSNQARSNPDLHKRIADDTAAIARREGIAVSEVPAELATQSGGGLDPHISPRAAQVQAARVAKARGVDAAKIKALIAANTEAPQFGALGQARVNVLRLNLALDAAR